MKLQELISLTRAAADDVAVPYLCSDDELKEFANDAENEACRRARLVTDATTPSICEIAVTSGTSTYALDKRVIFVRRAKLNSQHQALRSVDYRDLDEQDPSWESAQNAKPRAWVRNWESQRIRLWPTPNANDTLRLRVVRSPLAPMVSLSADNPEIPERFHRGLVNWMLFRFFSKKDTQTQDDKRAAEYLALFEQEFGAKSSAIDETWINENHGHDSYEGLY
jgi:hypothetical protein